MSDGPRFFATPERLRVWFARNAASAAELVLGFHKVGSGRPSVTWPQAVDEALCVGWIDGVRQRIDEHTYKIRFTRRKATSIWSQVNIDRVAALAAQGRMTEPGHAAFARRIAKKSAIYAYEQAEVPELAPAELKRFKVERAAFAWFEQQAPSYRKRMLWWVASAKKAATREARLLKLIEASVREVQL